MKPTQKHSTDYVNETTDKDTIVLHYTGGGSLSGAEATLAIKDYVNVHYAIDRDGTIYQYFPETAWAYHTGSGKLNDMHSIGIEIVNWGHLKRVGNDLLTWTGKRINWSEVQKCKAFRGFEYWQKLTPMQELSLAWLIADIKTRYEVIVKTHAELNTKKLDFPPDYEQIKSLLG